MLAFRCFVYGSVNRACNINTQAYTFGGTPSYTHSNLIKDCDHSSTSQTQNFILSRSSKDYQHIDFNEPTLCETD